MAEGNTKQPLGTEFQYAAFEKTPGENGYFSMQKPECVYLQLRHRMNHASISPGTRAESQRIFCLPVKRQQTKCPKRALGHQLELQAADSLIALSGHTRMDFLTLRDVFLQTLNLKLDVT